MISTHRFFAHSGCRDGRCTAVPETTIWLPFQRARCMVLTGCAVVATLLSGCGGDHGPERVVVSGTVTYNGKPVTEGTIRFVPNENSPVPTAGSPIVAGKYKVGGDRGVPVGTHKVQIEAFREMADPSNPGVAGPPRFGLGRIPPQYIPDRYNANTKLEITIPSGSREITKNFDLTN